MSKIPYKKCERKTFLITDASEFLARYMTNTLMYLKTRNYVHKARWLRCAIDEGGKNVQRLMISIEKLGKLNWRPEVGLNEGFRHLMYSEELERK